MPTRILYRFLFGLLSFAYATSAVPQTARVAQVPVGIPSGGRAVAVTVSPSSSNIVVAASFSGGLFKSQDGGHSWSHIDSLKPNRMSDVQFNPADGNELVASVSFDSHVSGFSGVWVSRDAGDSWLHSVLPNCGVPPAGHSISYGPGPNIYVGTECGLMASHDDGVHFNLVIGSTVVNSVVSQAGPQFASDPNSVIVDACDVAGTPRHSVNNGSTFVALPTPPGQCVSIAQSPIESNVLLTYTNSGDVMELDDPAGSWTKIGNVLQRGGRRPWVKTGPKYRGSGFQLYINSGVDMFVSNCAGSVQGTRCTMPTGFATFPFGAHHDFGGIAVPPSNCRIFVASDGGIEASIGCAGPPFLESNAGFNALQIYRIAGTVFPDHTNLYIGTQDNGIWASQDDALTWKTNSALGPDCPLVEAPRSGSGAAMPVTGIHGTFAGPAPFTIFNAAADFSTAVGFPLPPNSAQFQDIYLLDVGDQGPAMYLHTDDGCNAGSAAPCLLYEGDAQGHWTHQSPPLPFKQTSTHRLYIAGGVSNPTIYATTNKPAASGNGTVAGLSQISGIGQASLSIRAADTGLGDLAYWQPDDNPAVYPRVVGVDPNDAQHLIAADFSISKMVVSTNGGNSWSADDQLTNLVTDNGNLLFNEPFVGCQAHAIAFDPTNGQRIFVGTEANGVIATLNGGQKWFQVPGSARMSAISDFFFDEVRGHVWVATYGSGLWVISGLNSPTTLSAHATLLVATPTMHNTLVSVKDALTGLGVAGATVTVRDSRTGAVKATKATDANGIASLNYAVCTTFPSTNPPHIVPCAGSVFASGYSPVGFSAP